MMMFDVPQIGEALGMLGVPESERTETDRLRAALLRIATGGISPSIGFAQRVLLGASVADAHAAESALMFGDAEPDCRRCYDMRKCIDMTSLQEPRFYDCPDCTTQDKDDP